MAFEQLVADAAIKKDKESKKKEKGKDKDHKKHASQPEVAEPGNLPRESSS